MKRIVCLLLSLSVILLLASACVPSDDPSAGQVETPPEPMPVGDKITDETFNANYMELAVSLLQKTAEEKQGENLLISPLSIQLALAMTANGAAGQTREEMESVLGGKIPLEDLNAYLRSYVKELPSDEKTKLQIANSIWFRDNQDSLQVEEDFLQTNGNYYNAEIYKRAFNETTVKEINNWVDQKTDGMISKVLDKIDSSSMMYLINAIIFDAQWEEPYDEFSIRDGSFTALSGKEQTVPMMHGEESSYLESEHAIGFLKSYKGDQYSFAVLLPNENINIIDYVKALTAEELSKMLRDKNECVVFTQMPKFSYAFELGMNDVLKDMGMPTAFDPAKADLTKMGSSEMGNLYIGNVLHKTFIRVDGLGTQAGAVTVVEVVAEGYLEPDIAAKEVVVDRPFVYMILDNQTNTPIFVGYVTEIPE